MKVMAEDQATEAARKRVAEDKEIADISRREYAERTKGKPTPTQEECDLAVQGAHVVEKEDDGSGPDPFDPRNRETMRRQQSGEIRQSEPRPSSGPGGYTTRQTTPRPAPTRSGE
jgi:hypothetical protein